MKPCSKVISSAGSAKWIRQAEMLARSIKGKSGIKRQIIDGYKLTGSASSKNLRASVMDLPGKLITFGQALSGGIGALGEYTSPTRQWFATTGDQPLPAMPAEGRDSPLGPYLFIGSDLSTPNYVTASHASAFDGGVVLPFVLSSAPVQRIGNDPSWANIPLSTTLWLFFRVTYSGAGGPLRSVAIADSVIRQLAPGFDLVRRGLSSFTTLGASPFAECRFVNDSLYVTVPVQRASVGGNRRDCIGGMLTFRVDYVDGAAAINWHDFVRPGDLGVPALEVTSDADGELANHIASLALAVEPLDPPRLTVTGRARSSYVAPSGWDGAQNWLVTARVKAVYQSGSRSLSVSFLDVLAGTDAPVFAVIAPDPGQIVMRDSKRDVLIPTPDGLLEFVSINIGIRAAVDEGVLSGTVAAEMQRFHTLLNGAAVVQSSNTMGFATQRLTVGDTYYRPWLNGTSTSVLDFSAQVAESRGLLQLIENNSAPVSSLAIGSLSSAGIGQIYKPALSPGPMYVSVYQQEIVEDGEVIMPLGAVVTHADNLVLTNASIGLMRGELGSVEFAQAPYYALSGTFYMGNPFADMPYGDMRIIE